VYAGVPIIFDKTRGKERKEANMKELQAPGLCHSKGDKDSIFTSKYNKDMVL
jgi:hypothetical protein